MWQSDEVPWKLCDEQLLQKQSTPYQNHARLNVKTLTSADSSADMISYSASLCYFFFSSFSDRISERTLWRPAVLRLRKVFAEIVEKNTLLNLRFNLRNSQFTCLILASHAGHLVTLTISWCNFSQVNVIIEVHSNYYYSPRNGHYSLWNESKPLKNRCQFWFKQTFIFYFILKKIPLAIHATNEREKNLHRSKIVMYVIVIVGSVQMFRMELS